MRALVDRCLTAGKELQISLFCQNCQFDFFNFYLFVFVWLKQNCRLRETVNSQFIKKSRSTISQHA